MLSAATTASLKRDQGGESGNISIFMPMMNEMAKAINALSEQVTHIARSVSDNQIKSDPVHIEIKTIQTQIEEIRKATDTQPLLDRDLYN